MISGEKINFSWRQYHQFYTKNQKVSPFKGIIMKRKEIDEAKFLNYNKLVIELVEEEEKKEKKYKQLEFEFDEDLVAPI